MKAPRKRNLTGAPALSGRGGPRALWSLLAAVPLDAAGLYLVLSALHLVPTGWPAADAPSSALLAAAVALLALARVIALIAVRHLLRWRAASDEWSRTVVRDPHAR
jgi:hypothetical protein